MDSATPTPLLGVWVPPPPPCPYIVVLEGRECRCAVVGTHTTHRFRTHSGRRHEFELVELGVVGG
jgi:hypothetical protein